jgi:methyl-accepting chemotaxis protein
LSLLKTAAYGISYIVSAEYHSRITGSYSIPAEEYLEKQARLQEYVRQTGLKYLYTTMQFDDRIFFTSDIDDPFFEAYDSAPAELHQSFTDGEIHYALYTDDYGKFRSVFIPLKTADGRLFVIGADVEVSFIQQELYRLALQTVLYALLIFALFFLSAWLIISRISRPVTALTTAARSMQKGELSESEISRLSQTRGHDEIATLSRVFAGMAAEVKAREFRLKKQVEELRIEIDQAKKARQVAEITETDYFQNLQQKAREMRQKKGHAD